MFCEENKGQMLKQIEGEEPQSTGIMLKEKTFSFIVSMSVRSNM